MGKWTEVAYEDEMVRKTKFLFNLVQEKMKKDNPDNTFSFENFVDALDENDKFIRRLFEFLVKETLQRHRRSRSQSQPYPEHLEASTQRFRSRLSSLPFIRLTSSSEPAGSSETTDSSDGVSDERTATPGNGTGNGNGNGDRSASALPAGLIERVARRNSRLSGLPQELLELQYSQSQSHHGASAAARAAAAAAAVAAAAGAAHQSSPIMIDRRLPLSRSGNNGSGSSRPIAHIYRSSSSSSARHRESNMVAPNASGYLPVPEYGSNRHSSRVSPRLPAPIVPGQVDANGDLDGVLASDVRSSSDVLDRASAQQQQQTSPVTFAASPRLRPQYRQ